MIDNHFHHMIIFTIFRIFERSVRRADRAVPLSRPGGRTPLSEVFPNLVKLVIDKMDC